MDDMKSTYSGQDFVLIIPTKDRPEKLKNALKSIASQTILCGRLIVVDGGQSVKDLVENFSDRLPVEYYECQPPGQIRQRNMAISMLDSQTPLVCFLDDDIVLESEALEAMVNFWNKCEVDTAGVSFNIVNNPPFRHSCLRAIFGMSSPQQGRILRSGYNVANSPTTLDIKTQWLCGGATVWKSEIIIKFTNREVSSRWAICEDIIFSYPIGKKYPLYVCANAKVRHEHVYDHNAKVDHKYYGRAATLWRLHFVELNKMLSKRWFFYMISAQIVSRLCIGMFLFQKREIDYALGQIIALHIAIKALIKKEKILVFLEEDFIN